MVTKKITQIGWLDQSLLENPLLLAKSSKKIPNLNKHKKIPFHHFGQVNFDMSTMTRVVFLLAKYGPFDWSF